MRTARPKRKSHDHSAGPFARDRRPVLPIDDYGKQTETGIRGSSAKSAAADAILACLGERDNEGNVSNDRLAVTNSATARPAASSPSNCATETDSAHMRRRWAADRGRGRASREAEGLAKSPRHLQARASDSSTEFGARTRPFAHNLEVLAVDREKVRAEFTRADPADNRKAKGESFRRCEIEAVKRGFIVSRSIGEDPAATVFWLVRDDP